MTEEVTPPRRPPAAVHTRLASQQSAGPPHPGWALCAPPRGSDLGANQQPGPGPGPRSPRRVWVGAWVQPGRKLPEHSGPSSWALCPLKSQTMEVERAQAGAREPPRQASPLSELRVGLPRPHHKGRAPPGPAPLTLPGPRPQDRTTGRGSLRFTDARDRQAASALSSQTVPLNTLMEQQTY